MAGFSSLCRWYNKETDQAVLPDLLKAYVNGKADEAEALLNEYFEATLRARVLNSSENNYHYFICGAMASVSNRLGDWSFESNEQKALGYADLVFSNRRARKAVIIEEKALRNDVPKGLTNEEELDWIDSQVRKLSEEAFLQIQSTRYDAKYRRHGYTVTLFPNAYFRHEAYVTMKR